MSDFKTQQEIWKWLSEDSTRRVVNGLDHERGFRDGYIYNYREHCRSSIIFNNPSSWLKVRPKVKYLKSIKQILEEYPDAHFDKNGDLCRVGDDAIIPKMLSYFGKPFKDRDCGYNYDPNWVEEREED